MSKLEGLMRILYEGGCRGKRIKTYSFRLQVGHCPSLILKHFVCKYEQIGGGGYEVVNQFYSVYLLEPVINYSLHSR